MLIHLTTLYGTRFIVKVRELLGTRFLLLLLLSFFKKGSLAWNPPRSPRWSQIHGVLLFNRHHHIWLDGPLLTLDPGVFEYLI